MLDDHSNVIAADHTSAVILPAGTATAAIRFQNRSPHRVYLNSGAAASADVGSWELLPGQCIDETFLPVDADLHIYGCKGAGYTLKIA